MPQTALQSSTAGESGLQGQEPAGLHRSEQQADTPPPSLQPAKYPVSLPNTPPPAKNPVRPAWTRPPPPPPQLRHLMTK